MLTEGHVEVIIRLGILKDTLAPWEKVETHKQEQKNTKNNDGNNINYSIILRTNN